MALLSVCAAVFPTFAAFTVQGRQLLRDGESFQVRGVCYQPAPIGENPSASAPYGDYFTSNYGAITGRDLPLIRALGANVIRIYGWGATADHTAFLDACYHGGVDPIFVIVNRWIDPGTNWSSAAALSAIEQEFLQTDQGLGSHPAVLAIVLGNEANIQNGNGNNAAFWTAMNRFANAIKSQTPSRLVSVAITDSLPQIVANHDAVPALDFWCVQTYRGTTLGSLFSDYAAASTKPLLLTEFGIDAFNQTTGAVYPNNAAFVGETVAGLWNEIAANADVCVGACVFEYADEWWKTASGSASAHDNGGFALGGLPDGFANEEWWGLYAIADNGAGLDILTPRATVAALQTAWTPSEPAEPVSALAVVTSPVSQTIAPGGTASLQVEISGAASGATVTYQWFRDGVAIAGATEQQLPLANLTTSQTGWYTVQIADGVGEVVSAPAYVLVETPVPGRLKNLSVRSRSGTDAAPLVVGFVVADGAAQVLVRGIGPGLETYKVTGVSPDPQVQLYAGSTAGLFNDNWADATDSAAIVTAAQSVGAFSLDPALKDAGLLTSVAGPRSIHVRDANPGVALAEVYEVGANPGRLSNVSARTIASTGDNVLVVGFVIDGNVPKRMLVRGVGPGLSQFNVQGVLADPMLRVYSAKQEIVAQNDNWVAAVVSPVASQVGAFAISASGRDAALLVTLVPGAYTVHVSGADGTSGVALAEVYEVN